MRHGHGSHFWNAGDADLAKDFATETESIATRLNHSTLDIEEIQRRKTYLLPHTVSNGGICHLALVLESISRLLLK